MKEKSEDAARACREWARGRMQSYSRWPKVHDSSHTCMFVKDLSWIYKFKTILNTILNFNTLICLSLARARVIEKLKNPDLREKENVENVGMDQNVGYSNICQGF